MWKWCLQLSVCQELMRGWITIATSYEITIYIYLVSLRFSSPLLKLDSTTGCCSLVVSRVQQGRTRMNETIISRCQGLKVHLTLWESKKNCDFLQWIWNCSFLDISKLLLFYFAIVGASVTHHAWQWLPCHPSEVSGTRLLGALDRVIFWFGIVMTSVKLHCWEKLILLDTQCWAFAILCNHVLGHINKIYD